MPQLAPAQKVERLDRILNRLSPAPEPLPAVDSDWMTLLWGSYFGELLRREHGGAWAMTVYPRSDFSVPTLEIEGSHLYPMMKVHRRLAMGAGESSSGLLRDAGRPARPVAGAKQALAATAPSRPFRDTHPSSDTPPSKAPALLEGR